jgi:flagellar biogenesis protein FliO
MVGAVLTWCLFLAGDPLDRLGDSSPGVDTESNRPISISPQRIDRPGDEDPRVSPRADLKVVPTAGDRPSLASPDAVAEMPTGPESSSTGIKISPATRKSTLGQRSTKPDGDPSRESAASGRSFAWWTTTALGLGVVLTAIFLGGRVARRLVPGATVGETGGPVHLLHRTYLSPKHAVCLVKCGDRILMIGLSGDRMQTLSEIHDPQEIDYLRGQLMQVRPRSTTQAFREAFSGRTQMAEAQTPLAEEGASLSGESSEPAGRSFVDQLSTLRDQISRWKARAGT